MNIDQVKKICVVGAGNMGQQIALQCSLSGFRTTCIDTSKEQLEKADRFVDQYLAGRVDKGKLSQNQASSARANLDFVMELEIAAEADFVIEAIVEKIEPKIKLFESLDAICPKHTILTTNSSYIVSSRLAKYTQRPAQVCNMHFFNPALVMKCVEVVKGAHTAEETAAVTMELARRLNKEPVLLHKEIYGFLVNRILRQIRKEALFLYDTGVASVEDIDSAVENALGHPMGPFRLMDLTGIDLSYHAFMERYMETGDPDDKPSPTIVAKYVQGEWGKKVGKGFYDYSSEKK